MAPTTQLGGNEKGSSSFVCKVSLEICLVCEDVNPMFFCAFSLVVAENDRILWMFCGSFSVGAPKPVPTMEQFRYSYKSTRLELHTESLRKPKCSSMGRCGLWVQYHAWHEHRSKLVRCFSTHAPSSVFSLCLLYTSSHCSPLPLQVLHLDDHLLNVQRSITPLLLIASKYKSLLWIYPQATGGHKSEWYTVAFNWKPHSLENSVSLSHHQRTSLGTHSLWENPPERKKKTKRKKEL